MAKKSKTQRAKASARRAEKKEQAQLEPVAPAAAEQKTEEKKSKSLFSKKSSEAVPERKASKAEPKKEGFLARRFGFLKDVRAELRRVTWPTRIDVLRWSGVVVVALLFFSLYVFVLDNWIVTPLLVAISSLGV